MILRPRCRRRAGSLSAFHSLWVGKADDELLRFSERARSKDRALSPCGADPSRLGDRAAKTSSPPTTTSNLGGRPEWTCKHGEMPAGRHSCTGRSRSEPRDRREIPDCSSFSSSPCSPTIYRMCRVATGQASCRPALPSAASHSRSLSATALGGKASWIKGLPTRRAAARCRGGLDFSKPSNNRNARHAHQDLDTTCL
jgi:hypothetical protein